jgi:hypothetical protein
MSASAPRPSRLRELTPVTSHEPNDYIVLVNLGGRKMLKRIAVVLFSLAGLALYSYVLMEEYASEEFKTVAALDSPE